MRGSRFTPSRVLGIGEELLSIELLEEHARRFAALLSLAPAAAVAAAARTCAGSGSTCAHCARSTRARRRRAAARRCRPRPSGCSTTSTSSRPPRATSITICRPSFFRRLPRVAADEFAGLPRIYALALELIRIERRPPRRAAAAPVHHRLSVGDAADDRRALGVAERAEARARRTSARARRRARRQPRAPTRRGPAGRGARGRRIQARRVADAGPSRVRHPAASALARVRRARVGTASGTRTRRSPRAGRRSRMRFDRRDSIRPPSRRRWPT